LELGWDKDDPYEFYSNQGFDTAAKSISGLTKLTHLKLAGYMSFLPLPLPHPPCSISGHDFLFTPALAPPPHPPSLFHKRPRLHIPSRPVSSPLCP